MTVPPGAETWPEQDQPKGGAVRLDGDADLAVWPANIYRVVIYLFDLPPRSWRCLASQVLSNWAATLRLSVLLLIVIAAGVVWTHSLLGHGVVVTYAVGSVAIGCVLAGTTAIIRKARPAQ